MRYEQNKNNEFYFFVPAAYKMLIIRAFRPLGIAFALRHDARGLGRPFPCSASSSRRTIRSARWSPTLAALVPGATAGIVREVIVADGGSRDDTEQVADIAGCRFLSSVEPLGARLKAAARDGARRLADVPASPALCRDRAGSTTPSHSSSRTDRAARGGISPRQRGIAAAMRRALCRRSRAPDKG